MYYQNIPVQQDIMLDRIAALILQVNYQRMYKSPFKNNLQNTIKPNYLNKSSSRAQITHRNNNQCKNNVTESKIKTEISRKQSISPNTKQTINRLYNKHQEKKQKIQELENIKKKQQVSKLKNFKVENKNSIRINQKNNLRPLAERVTDILKSKQKKIIQKLINVKPNQYDQQSSLRKQKNGRTYKAEDVELFKKKNEDWQRKKNQNINIQKMQIMNQQFQKFKDKPDLDVYSKELITKSSLQGKNFFQRIKFYQKNKQKKIQQIEKEIKHHQIPFVPNINKNSRIIASKSTRNLNQSNVFQRISKSPSRQHFYQQQQNKKNIKKSNLTTPRTGLLKSKSTLKTSIGQQSSIKMMQYAKTSKIIQSFQSSVPTQRISFKDSQFKGSKFDINQSQKKQEIKNILMGNRNELVKFLGDLLAKQKKNRVQRDRS